MDVLTFTVEPELDIEERLRLKDRIADAYRAATETRDEIGVDRVESQVSIYLPAERWD